MEKLKFSEKLKLNGTKFSGGFSSITGGSLNLEDDGGLNLKRGCGQANNCQGGNCVPGCGVVQVPTETVGP